MQLRQPVQTEELSLGGGNNRVSRVEGLAGSRALQCGETEEVKRCRKTPGSPLTAA